MFICGGRAAVNCLDFCCNLYFTSKRSYTYNLTAMLEFHMPIAGYFRHSSHVSRTFPFARNFLTPAHKFTQKQTRTKWHIYEHSRIDRFNEGVSAQARENGRHEKLAQSQHHSLHTLRIPFLVNSLEIRYYAFKTSAMVSKPIYLPFTRNPWIPMVWNSQMIWSFKTTFEATENSESKKQWNTDSK